MNYETMFEHLVRDNPETKKILLKPSSSQRELQSGCWCLKRN